MYGVLLCTDTPGQPFFLIFFTSTKVLKEGPKWEMKDQVLFKKGEEKEEKKVLRGCGETGKRMTKHENLLLRSVCTNFRVIMMGE